ncbi:MAG: 5'-nucleotidase C-terminal domain-containing protein [Bacteriodetes bacterium]|nr:5'-nucleotidase C-terminal domain-containing protein [Bacteroidota bacterium]
MKTALLLAALVITSCMLQAADTLTIIHVNDTHSNLAPGGSRDNNLQGTIGGIARAATYIGMTKQQFPNTLVLHAGDIYIGDLFFQKYYGVAELQLMAQLGFDAMTVGNHEFDLTPTTLQTALDTAFATGIPFPLLSANLILDNDTVKGLKKYIQPSVVKTVGGLNVGIFGLTTPETNVLSLPAPAVLDTNIIQIAMAQVAELKAKNCNVIILLSHLGLDLDKIVAQYVDGINLIVGGHDHYTLNKPVTVNNIPIVQAGAFYHEIGLVQIEVKNGSVTILENKVTELNATIPEEPTVAGVVNMLVADIENTYGKVYTEKIADATHTCSEVAVQLTENGSKDTPLGNYICDTYKLFGATEIALQPGGSIAQQIYQGPLVAADAFRTVGYGFNMQNGLGFHVVRFNVTGMELLTGLTFGLSNITVNDEFLLQCSGMKYSYNPDAELPQRLTGVEINGQPINPSTSYSVTTNEFVMSFFAMLNIAPTNIHIFGDTTEFMVLSGRMMLDKSVNPVTEGRITSVKSTNAVEQQTTVNFSAKALPQPAAEQLTINTPVELEETAQVKIFASNLIEHHISHSTHGNTTILDTTSLLNGMYIYKITSNNTTFVGTFIVNK